MRSDRLRSKSPKRAISANRVRSPSVSLQPPQPGPLPHAPGLGGSGAAAAKAKPRSASEPAAAGPESTESTGDKSGDDKSADDKAGWWSSGVGYKRSSSASRGKGQSSSSSGWQEPSWGMPMPGSGCSTQPPWKRSTTPRPQRDAATTDDTPSEFGYRTDEVDVATCIEILKGCDIDHQAMNARLIAHTCVCISV